MLRKLVLGAAALAAPAVLAGSAAAAGDPTMPLADVRAGMQCTGYSVFSGQRIDPFGVQVIAVVGQAQTSRDEPRILFTASGANVERTGIAQGFSGSPIYCPGADGVPRIIGAASESVGEYGDRKALATPIEQVVGTPVTPSVGVAAKVRRRWARNARAHRALLRTARPLASPLALGGLSTPVLRGLQTAGARRGVVVHQATGPAPVAPFTGFRPGAAVAVGYTSGDLTMGATGTVAYTDGPNVWAFGHELDAGGRRALFLQDASIADVIVNPTLPQIPQYASYKLGGPVGDVGTLSSDGLDAVAGTLGAGPPSIPVTVTAKDLDTGASHTTAFHAADETSFGNPTGISALATATPLALLDAATRVLGARPLRTAGELCLRLQLAGRKAPLRFCNRYVADDVLGVASDDGFSTVVGTGAAADAAKALTAVDTFAGRPPKVLAVSARLTVTRGQRMAYLRRVELPRRVRRGATVRGTFVVQVVRGDRRRIPFRLTVPRVARRGERPLLFRGPGPDSADPDAATELVLDLGGGEDAPSTEQTGPRSVAGLARAVKRVGRYDGVRLGSPRTRVLRDPGLRIGGEAVTTIRVRRR